MKSINTTRNVTIKYPRNTPRISRKRLWMDRSEWRKNPQGTLEGSTQLIDAGLERGRTVPTLEATPYQDFADMTNRIGTIGIKKV